MAVQANLNHAIDSQNIASLNAAVIEAAALARTSCLDHCTAELQSEASEWLSKLVESAATSALGKQDPEVIEWRLGVAPKVDAQLLTPAAARQLTRAVAWLLAQRAEAVLQAELRRAIKKRRVRDLVKALKAANGHRTAPTTVVLVKQASAALAELVGLAVAAANSSHIPEDADAALDSLSHIPASMVTAVDVTQVALARARVALLKAEAPLQEQLRRAVHERSPRLLSNAIVAATDQQKHPTTQKLMRAARQLLMELVQRAVMAAARETTPHAVAAALAGVKQVSTEHLDADTRAMLIKAKARLTQLQFQQQPSAALKVATTLWNSSYLAVYNATDKKPQQVPNAGKKIQRALSVAVGSEYGKQFQQLRELHKATIVQAVIRMWSDGSDKAVYADPSHPALVPYHLFQHLENY